MCVGEWVPLTLCVCVCVSAWDAAHGSNMSKLYPHKVLQVFSLPPHCDYRSCKSPFSPQKFCLFIASLFRLLLSLLAQVWGFIFVSEKFSVGKAPKGALQLYPALPQK